MPWLLVEILPMLEVSVRDIQAALNSPGSALTFLVNEADYPLGFANPRCDASPASSQVRITHYFIQMQHIRNIAIIAHVDHGKTTLVDCLLKQSGTFRANQHESQEERLMDSMDLEREKGITIRAKNAAFKYRNFHINIVDTPGHADFGGEVERIMNMIDGVLLVVDSVDGPQAQTRFVLRKALEAGAKPIVVINKIDRDNAMPHKVLDAIFDLFVSLHATDEQLDFPVIYASAKGGYAKEQLDHASGTMEPLFEAIIKHIPPPRAHAGEGFKLLVANLDFSEYLGRIALGKIVCGKVKVGDPSVCIHGDGRKESSKVTAIYHFEGMKRIASLLVVALASTLAAPAFADDSPSDLDPMNGCIGTYCPDATPAPTTPAKPAKPAKPVVSKQH